MVERTDYLNKLIYLKETKHIKLITGVKKCGKWTLLTQYIDYLKNNGIDETQLIIPKSISNAKELISFIEEKSNLNKMNYIFIREPRFIADFEQAIKQLLNKSNIDLYISWSNNDFENIYPLLSKKYIEIRMFSLSFKEYEPISKSKELLDKYLDYTYGGSFPFRIEFSDNKHREAQLEAIYNSIMVKEVLIKSPMTSLVTVEYLLKYILTSIGTIVSGTKIAQAMNEAEKKITVPTVNSHLKLLLDSFIIHEAERYDLKDNKILASGRKYYACDTGLIYSLLENKEIDKRYLLENIVYLELLQRGYNITVGKLGNNEITFITKDKKGKESYFQVAYSIPDEKTLLREIAGLKAIDNSNPKYLLTMDKDMKLKDKEINPIFVLDWLLK